MILAVVRTHFARLKRDRAALVLSFIVPIVFFSVFASIFGGSRRPFNGGQNEVETNRDGAQERRHIPSRRAIIYLANTDGIIY